MGESRTEPSMEDILASIKRIIADEGVGTPAPRRAMEDAPPPPAPAGEPPEPVLELTEPIAPPRQPAATAPLADDRPPPRETLVSEDAAVASRHALSSLSSMVLNVAGRETTLDGLMRELLRPLLKDWLDARLPELVETLVEREIRRITGK